MRLGDLLAGAGVANAAAASDVEIASVVYDSRRAAPGSLFVAIRGERADGNQFALDAVARGARAVVSEAEAPVDLPAGAWWLRVADARKALAAIGANFFGRPAERLRLVGVTGTNGKTTTSFLIDSILRAAGNETGLFGTILHRTPAALRPASHTTPESLDLQGFLAELVGAGGSHAVLEVSSHALALDRVWGCRFAVAVFTNLTRDHLDFHSSAEEYAAAKRRLFEGTGAGPPEIGVVNLDDPCAGQFAGLAARTLTYGFSPEAEVTARKIAPSAKGLEFAAESPAGRIEVRSPLLGRTNAANLLAAVAAAVALEIPRAAIEAGIGNLEAVPGRFERVDLGQPYLVMVDYAHTDDALRGLTATARELVPNGRVITLFGCGGDRDRAKRPLMGEAAGRGSDIVVLTSDNPRGEDPLLIINDALVGLQRTAARVLVEPDRERATELALDQAVAGDVVLIAGKGHETKQIFKDRSVEFDDREAARRALRRRGYGD